MVEDNKENKSFKRCHIKPSWLGGIGNIAHQDLILVKALE